MFLPRESGEEEEGVHAQARQMRGRLPVRKLRKQLERRLGVKRWRGGGGGEVKEVGWRRGRTDGESKPFCVARLEQLGADSRPLLTLSCPSHLGRVARDQTRGRLRLQGVLLRPLILHLP